MNIPFVDLKAQFEALEDEIRAGIDRVLAHGKFIMGPEIAELERALAEFAGVEHAVTCSSGTDALLMPLMAWDIGSGDAVFTTAFSFVATAEVISLVGATPIFVDIDPRTFNIDAEKLSRAVTQVEREGKLRPRCIIPVDLFGLPAAHEEIAQVARSNGLKVLDDAAQAFGAEYNGRRMGSFGDACATSFFPAKPLGCYGDGGAVLTNSAELAQVLRSIRVHGQGSHKYHNVRLGLNARMDTLQAAILLPKLRVFEAELERRQVVAQAYDEALKDLATTPLIPAGCRSAWAQYSILVDDRDALAERLREAGIPSAIYYQAPLYQMPVYRSLDYGKGACPEAEAVCERILSLPMHPYLTAEAQQRIVWGMAEFLGKTKLKTGN
ncbi:MAG: DegT/DnrJ/EryC1/StrS family aminotransferase [Gammaproteobacteria bacterium]|nr:DegT/DnrJ/EryC1/StrS family aminotransferase [Gammaproteobacteria bacterium]